MLFRIYGFLFEILFRFRGQDFRTHRRDFFGQQWKSDPSLKRIHFHASSVGELEILMPLIERCLEENRSFDVTCFSASAIHRVRKVSGEGYRGFSPDEKDWDHFLEKSGAQIFILAKYDLWPGMLRALGQHSISLLILHAQNRTSLNWTFFLFRFFGLSLPTVFFQFRSVREQKDFQLQVGSRIENVFDFRRLRILARAIRSRLHPKVERLHHQIAGEKVAVWGSVWPSDLKHLAHQKDFGVSTIVIVPHDLKSLPELKKCAEQLESRFKLIWVEEQGYLLETYQLAAWAYVGGGFESGIHSVLEPMVYGIPVVCGPRNVDRFGEALDGMEKGQLKIWNGGQDLLSLLPRWDTHPSDPQVCQVEWDQASKEFENFWERIKRDCI